MLKFCNNKMLILHDDPEMIRQAAIAFNDKALLNFFYPMPHGFDDSPRYNDWRAEHWGTKCDIFNIVGDIDDVDGAAKDGYLGCYFLTVGGPPLGALENAHEILGFEVGLEFTPDYIELTEAIRRDLMH